MDSDALLALMVFFVFAAAFGMLFMPPLVSVTGMLLGGAIAAFLAGIIPLTVLVVAFAVAVPVYLVSFFIMWRRSAEPE